MTSRITSFFAFVLLAVMAAGCTKKETKTQGLAGNWEWKSTDGGLGAHLHQTPASTGKTERLKLTTDFKYYRYTNNLLSEEGSYQLSNQTCIHDHTLKTVIRFSGSQQGLMVEAMGPQQLVLSDENFDGVTLLYERNNLMDN